MQLNPQQLSAVTRCSAPLLVLAGAGSGKTRVITAKIAHLLRHEGLAPEQVFAVTFTNKAAREMTERVGASVGANGRKVSISTFHKLGLRILRDHAEAAGLRSGFSIFDAGDAESLLKELIKLEAGGALEPAALKEAARQAMTVIGLWKDELLTPAEAAARATTATERRFAGLFEAYQTHLQQANAVDFDDLIARPTRLLVDASDVRALWQARVRHLLVDEYQDTNRAQYSLIRQLVGERGALTVVGDDDQSIYAWRGARPENLVQLGEDYPTLEVVKLEQNYRSRSLILKAANGLIANNPHLFAKRLWSERGPGDAIRIIEVDDEEAEADRIASEMMDRRLRQRMDWRDFAVLYRSNHQPRQLELRMQALQIPYRISGGGSFFDRAEVRDAVAYLRLLVNPRDDAALLRVINVPRRQIGLATLTGLQGIAARRRCSLLHAIDSTDLTQSLGSAPAARLREFARLLGSHRDAMQRTGDDLRRLLEAVRYEDWLAQQSNDALRSAQRWSNLHLIFDALNRRSAEGASAEEALRSLMLDALDDGDDDEDRDEVQLLTLHAGKGLEFPHVYLMGMEEGILPHRNSTSDDAIAEERRLAYVGITRAMDSLAVTVTRHRRQYGERTASDPSRFLNELPEDTVLWEGRVEASPEQRDARAHASISALRDMLD